MFALANGLEFVLKLMHSKQGVIMKSIQDLISPLLSRSAVDLDKDVLGQVLTAAYASQGLQIKPTPELVAQFQVELGTMVSVTYDGKGNEAGFVAVVTMVKAPLAVVTADGTDTFDVKFVANQLKLTLFLNAAATAQANMGLKTRPREFARHGRRSLFPAWFADHRMVRLQPVADSRFDREVRDSVRSKINEGLCFVLTEGRALRVTAYQNHSGHMVVVNTEQGGNQSYHASQLIAFDGDIEHISEILPAGFTPAMGAQQFAEQGAAWCVSYVRVIPGVGCEIELSQTQPDFAIASSISAWLNGADAYNQLLPYLDVVNKGYFTADAVQDKLSVLWKTDIPLFRNPAAFLRQAAELA